jgi:hypothetical protein
MSGRRDVSNFCLNEWPFRIVPDPEFCKIWANREDLYKTWEDKFSYVIRRKTSAIYIIWGYYGSGKTHGLLHFKWKLFENQRLAFVVYHEFPKNARKFLDIYREFAKNMDFQEFCKILRLIRQKVIKNEKNPILFLNKYVTGNWTELSKIFLMLSQDQNIELAERWIKCEKVSLFDLKKVGIGERIEESTDAIRALGGIVRALTLMNEKINTYKAVIWMIDECQALQKIYPRNADEIKANLTSVFNTCPNNFCLALAFKSDSPSTIQQALSEDMVKRLPLESMIHVPAFKGISEAKSFILDLLAKFRPQKKNVPDEFFPFSEEAIDTTLRFIAEKTNEITPRDLMVYFDKILDAADLEGRIKSTNDRIDFQFVIKTLSNITL